MAVEWGSAKRGPGKFVVPHPAQMPGRIEAAATYNGTNLYLSVNPKKKKKKKQPQRTIGESNHFATNATQIWLRAANSSSSGVTNYTYVNQLSGLMMYAPGGNGGLVTQTNLISQNTDWYDGNDEGNGFHAIRIRGRTMDRI